MNTSQLIQLLNASIIKAALDNGDSIKSLKAAALDCVRPSGTEPQEWKAIQSHFDPFKKERFKSLSSK